MKSSILGAVSTAIVAATLVVPASAATQQRAPSRYLSPAERGIAADVARVPAGVRDFGRIGAAQRVQIGVLLRVRNETQLQRLVLAQADPRSRYFHRFLTKEQFDAEFAPSAQVYARTMALLQRRGFHIDGTYPNRAMIIASGDARTAERYFSTELHSVFQEKRGVRYTNVRPAVMPAELRDVAVSVSGLHSVVMMQFPHRFFRPTENDRALLRARLAALHATVAAESRSDAAARSKARPLPSQQVRRPFVTYGTSTPPPGPNPTESPESSLTDYETYFGFGPPVFATGYDYPVQHGYGGTGHAAGSVIDADYKDSDATAEYAAFPSVKRTGTTSATGIRRCADPVATAKCDGTIGAGDTEGESTLDAMAILTLAPNADFYEYLAPAFSDMQIEAAYELAVSDDKVDAVNSSFGGCETDDPSFEYSAGYIAMEGAALGISFMASTGDTGAFGCGVYASNGVPQTELNVEAPSAALYFTGVGGTTYEVPELGLGATDYSTEVPWTFGGGGHSVIEPIPEWQTTLVGQSSPLAMVSTTFRNLPDVSMVGDPGLNPDGFIGGTGPGAGGLVITLNGSQEDSGGTSLSSPMFVAMQTDINHATGSRAGFANPTLYSIAAQSSAEYTFAYNDIGGTALSVAGENAYYLAETGYDDASGIGSPHGFELAGAGE